MANQTDTYTAKITVEASAALGELASLTANIELYKKQILDIQKVTEDSFNKIGIAISRTNAFKAAPDIKALSIAVGDLNKEARATVAFLNAMRGINNAAVNAQKGATGLSGSFQKLGDIGRFVFGSVLGITAVTALRSVINYMNEAVQAGIEYSNTLFKLSASIKLLQNLGMDITFEDSLKVVRELREEFGVFTTKDLTNGIAQIQLLMRNFEFTSEQIKEVARLSAALAIIQGKDVSEAAKELALFFSSGYAESLQRAGFAVNRVTVLQKAQAMGLIELGQGYQQLTEPQRALAGYTLVMEQAGDLTNLATQAQEQGFGKILAFSKAWEQLSDTIGLRLNPGLAKFAENLTGVLTGLRYFFDLAVYLQIQLETNLTAAILTVTFAVGMLWDALKGGKGASLDDIVNKFNELKTQIFDEEFRKAFPEQFDPLEGYASSNVPDKVAEDTEEIQSIIEELNNEIEDIERDGADRRIDIWIDYFRDLEQLALDHARRMADINSDLQRDLADIDTEYAQDVEDENRDYANKVGEAARDAANQRADAERKYRDQELIAELRFQERMRQLREGFLFDLEDAVRERDARQIIRLTRQYNMEREQLIREEEINRKERLLAYQRQLEEIERQKAARMASLYSEHMARLQELAIQAEREREQARLEAERKKEDERLRYEQEKADRKTRLEQQLVDLDTDLQRRIEKVAAKLLEEYNVTATQLDAIASEYERIYGPGGRIDRAFQYYLQLLAMAKSSSLILPGDYKPRNYAPPLPPGNAEGGTQIATKPTWALFGEAGPEMATFTPLGRAGVNVGRTQGSTPAGMSGRGGGNGRLLVELRLSPGLEYQIIDQTLNELAGVMASIERARK